MKPTRYAWDDAPPKRREEGAEMTAAPQDDLPHDNNAPVTGAHPMLSATHYCRDCRALWRQCDDFTFNLRSTQCCDKCNNTPCGDQLIPLVDQLRHYESQLSEAAADQRELRDEHKALRLHWLRAKSILNEFLAWHENGARMDSLQLQRVRDMAVDLLDN